MLRPRPAAGNSRSSTAQIKPRNGTGRSVAAPARRSQDASVRGRDNPVFVQTVQTERSERASGCACAIVAL